MSDNGVWKCMLYKEKPKKECVIYMGITFYKENNLHICLSNNLPIHTKMESVYPSDEVLDLINAQDNKFLISDKEDTIETFIDTLKSLTQSLVNMDMKNENNFNYRLSKKSNDDNDTHHASTTTTTTTTTTMLMTKRIIKSVNFAKLLQLKFPFAFKYVPLNDKCSNFVNSCVDEIFTIRNSSNCNKNGKNDDDVNNNKSGNVFMDLVDKLWRLIVVKAREIFKRSSNRDNMINGYVDELMMTRDVRKSLYWDNNAMQLQSSTRELNEVMKSVKNDSCINLIDIDEEKIHEILKKKNVNLKELNTKYKESEKKATNLIENIEKCLNEEAMKGIQSLSSNGETRKEALNRIKERLSKHISDYVDLQLHLFLNIYLQRYINGCYWLPYCYRFSYLKDHGIFAEFQIKDDKDDNNIIGDDDVINEIEKKIPYQVVTENETVDFSNLKGKNKRELNYYSNIFKILHDREIKLNIIMSK